MFELQSLEHTILKLNSDFTSDQMSVEFTILKEKLNKIGSNKLYHFVCFTGMYVPHFLYRECTLLL